ncbi:uncharacterized protein LOC134693503 [Mytilus trossulus]|uniref:uncharacterized protein LOC134693503 n=1 Tax=Mytilus trossulus TaxID=6551 RepID=UPI003006E10E
MNFIRELHAYRSQKGLDVGGTVPLAFISTVNGYHSYHRKPLDGIRFMMNCQPEPTNRHDINAVLVKAPTDVDPNILDIETHTPPRRQTVRDLLGHTIGHVPRNICGILSICMLHRRTLQSAVCFFTGEMIHDHQGPKLKSVYCLVFDSFESARSAADILKLYVDEQFIYI